MKHLSSFSLSDFVRRHGKPPNTILMHKDDFQRLKDHYTTSITIMQGEDHKDAKYCAVGSMKYMDMDIKISEQVKKGQLFLALIEEVL